MERGLYIAASGMLTELARQDQIANDLANASTPGYKPERAAQRSFGELLLANRATGARVGHLGLGAEIAELRTDFTQGALRETGEPLDVALVGDGFLAVETAAGTRYTRNGQLALEADGRLVTATGHPVLADNGQPLVVPGGEAVTIGADGTVSAGGRSVGRLAVVSLRDARKEGDSLYAGTPGRPQAGTQVKQGALEASAVNSARAMVDMIVSLRPFESSQRVIRALDETLGKGITAGGAGGS